MEKITNPAGFISYEDVKAAVDEALPTSWGEEIMATIADTLIARGFQQGIKQGIQQGALQNAKEDVIEVLEVHFESVPQAIRDTIQEIDDLSLLKILHRKAIQVGSIEEFEHAVEFILK